MREVCGAVRRLVGQRFLGFGADLRLLSFGRAHAKSRNIPHAAEAALIPLGPWATQRGLQWTWWSGSLSWGLLRAGYLYLPQF